MFAGTIPEPRVDPARRAPRGRGIMRRTLVLAIAVLVTAVAAAPAALADKPIKATEESTESGLLTDCGDFEALRIENWTLTSWEFYREGELDRIQFHLDIDGTIYNSDEPDKAFSSVAHYNFVTYSEDLFVIWERHGLFYRIDFPQGGHVLIDVGNFTVELVD